MDRTTFTQSFARRLIQLMLDQGFNSNRSKDGVETTKLAQATNCSYQMARRYVMGKALPELFTVTLIAKWLNTTPSWLLFGERDLPLSSKKTGAIIEIEPDLLKYILTKSMLISTHVEDKEDIISHIVECIYDASHLKADKVTVYKIIDMMFSSFKFINNTNKRKKA